MLLKLVNIKKHFKISHNRLIKAVDDVSLTVNAGEHLSLIGESGCGKTTLARLIMKLYATDTGSISFDGEDVTQARGERLKCYRQNVQMVFQDPFASLDPRFSIRRIFQEALHLTQLSKSSTSLQEEKMQEALKSVKLQSHMLNRYPHEFSGGERQRIAIARSLLRQPKLLVLDEAVSSLDVIVQHEIISLLKELQAKFNLTYLLISHNLKVSKQLTTKTAVMYQGKIVELASTEEIFANPLHPYTQQLLAAALHYRAAKVSVLPNAESARLVEQNKGHFVLK